MMMGQGEFRPELFVVDDDCDVRNLLAYLFGQEGYEVSEFQEAISFLIAARTRTPSCVLLDIQMPGASGIEALKDLDARRYGAPVLMMSARADIPIAIEAVKNGAFDFIEKPFDIDTLAARVRSAIAGWKDRLFGKSLASGAVGEFRGWEVLTPREREVLLHIAGGSSNKEAGRLLNISPRTIEVHRARIMDKLKARNTADLIRIVLTPGR